MSTTTCSLSTTCIALSPRARSPDPGDVKRFSRSLDVYERVGSGDNRRVTAEVGRRLIDGALAFADGDYPQAVEAILPVRHEAVRIGGSHAQRDIVNLTLIAAAERSGQWRLARALLAERAARPADRAHACRARAGARPGGGGVRSSGPTQPDSSFPIRWRDWRPVSIPLTLKALWS